MGRIVVHKKTHIKLANKVASKIGINIFSEEAAHLRGGSVAPDDWKDFPHHYGKESAIRSRIVNSRKALLEGKKEVACSHLGVAFHYLADKWTLMTGSDSRHASWERSIETSMLIDDVGWIIRSSGIPDVDKHEYYSFLQELDCEPVGKDETLRLALLSRPSTWSTPSADLNIAYRICLKIAQSVFSSITPPPEILKQIEEVGERLEKTANKFFYFLWFFVGFMVISFGLGWLLAFNVGAAILLGLVVFPAEFLSLAIFPVKKFSRFENVQHLCSAIIIWKALTFLLPILFIFLIVGFGTSWSSLFYSGLGLFLHWCLSFYLYYKPGADKMGTYVSWYQEPKSSENK